MKCYVSLFLMLISACLLAQGPVIQNIEVLQLGNVEPGVHSLSDSTTADTLTQPIPKQYTTDLEIIMSVNSLSGVDTIMLKITSQGNEVYARDLAITEAEVKTTSNREIVRINLPGIALPSRQRKHMIVEIPGIPSSAKTKSF